MYDQDKTMPLPGIPPQHDQDKTMPLPGIPPQHNPKQKNIIAV